MNLFENIPIIEKAPKKKTTNTAIAKQFLDWYFEQYPILFGVPAKIAWEKDVKLIASILKTYEDVEIFGCSEKLEFLIKACEKYFISKDAFALRTAWSVSTFYTNISKIVLLLKHEEERVIDPIIEGYRIAYFNYTGNRYEESLIGKEGDFSQIYLFLKPLWIQYSEFSLLRFSEIFFLIILDHLGNKEYNISFFYSKYARDFFNKWLEIEGKESLMFFPKELGNMTKEQLEIEERKMTIEERALINR